MVFSIPIYCLRHNGEHITGILAARVDLKHSLYALLLNRTGMGDTSETLIVNKDVVALNELRWRKRAPLELKMKAKPAFSASRGETGVVETGDYRGEKVLAAYTYIPRTNWGFVAKQDIKEIYSPIRYISWHIKDLQAAVLKNNKLLCDGCELDSLQQCHIQDPQLLKNLAISDVNLHRLTCLATATGILKQRLGKKGEELLHEMSKWVKID